MTDVGASATETVTGQLTAPAPALPRFVHWLGQALWPALALVLGLFMTLAFCCAPVADDFILATRLREQGFWPVQAFWYEQWTGKYFGMLVSTTFLHVFGLFERYWLCPLLLVAGTCAACYAMVRVLGGTWSRPLRRRDALFASLLLLGVFFVGIRSPAESFFWLTSACEYQVASIGAITCVALLLRRPRIGGARVRNGVLTVLVVLAAVGCTETMMVAFVLGALSWLGATVFVARRAPHLQQVCVCAALFAGAAAMILAPGNSARAAAFPEAGQLGFTLAQSTKRALWIALCKWSITPALLGATLMFWRYAPAIWRAGLRRLVRFRMTNPLPVLWLLLLVIACTTPAYWAGGFKPPKRAEGNIWVVFLLGWFTLVLPFAYGLLRKRRFWRSKAVGKVGRALFAVGLFVPGNVPYALADVCSGTAFRYRAEQSARYAAVIDARARGATEVTVPVLVARPRLLWIDDLVADPADWRNEWFARWFGVKSVVAVAARD